MLSSNSPRHRTARWTRIARLVALALLCCPMLAHAWWNNDWAYRKKIVLDGAATPALTGPVQQVLVPIRLHVGNFLFFDAQPSGADLRFVGADDKTPLNFHIEQYDATNGIALLWVQVPTIGAKDSIVYLYYGNPQATAASNSKASFDPHTVAAFHFAETEGPPRDSTGYANSASRSGGSLRAMGAIGFGLGLKPDQNMRIPGAPSLATPEGTGWTVGLWLRTADAAASGTILSREEGGKRLVFGLDAGRPYLETIDAGKTARITVDKPIDGATWHHLAFTLADRASVLVDGQEAASGSLRLPDLKGDVLVGAGEAGAGGIAGEIDELQICNLARPADWLRAAAVSQDPQDKLAQYGGDESGSGSDYMAVLRTLLNAVSFDGWVVISLIALLGLISLEVMVGKLHTLGRMQRQNAQFLAVFREGSSALARLDEEAARHAAQKWSESPLFRLFARGLSELTGVRKITGGEVTPQALEVVRAGLDAMIVEESHRMNNRLVFLTLSVSGAPFLGLLGTVIGIMITFASIAMEGDVNVNTIAPGVAAALTATVSGLLVAIPVLFGYNFLATRIRELTANMEVFANELLGKLALRSSLGQAARASPHAPAPGGVAPR